MANITPNLRRLHNMNKILGQGVLVTDVETICNHTGDDQEGRSDYKGILLYKGSYWIDVCKDGTYHLHIERSEYSDPDLSKLEAILADWVQAEEEGAKAYEAERAKSKSSLEQIAPEMLAFIKMLVAGAKDELPEDHPAMKSDAYLVELALSLIARAEGKGE